MSVNKAILIGYLGKDPEVRYMPNGDAVANVSLATSESYKDKDGQKQNRSEWHNVVFYKRLAEIVGQYLKKGSMVYVEGRIHYKKWQDKDGRDRHATEIVASEMRMLGGKANNAEKADNAEVPSADAPIKAPGATTAPSGNGAFDFDDDIPF